MNTTSIQQNNPNSLDNQLWAILALQILQLLATFWAPIVSAIALFVKRIQKCNCCKSNVELAPSSPNNKDPTIV